MRTESQYQDATHSNERRVTGERRSKSKELRKKYFVISEGMKSEPMYFDMVKNNAVRLGIDRTIVVIPVWRCKPQSGCSNWDTILDLTDQYVLELKNQKHTPKLYAVEYVEELSKKITIGEKEMIDRVEELTQKLKERSVDGLIDDDLAKKICDETVSDLNVSLTDISQIEQYDPDIDVISIFIDRDKNKSSSDENKTEGYLKHCKEKGYVPYISNPCFELWLLLHFKIVSDDKITCKRITNELKEKYGYVKNRPNFSTYVDRVSAAAINSKSLCTDIDRLDRECGTNIGLFIERLKRST